MSKVSGVSGVPGVPNKSDARSHCIATSAFVISHVFPNRISDCLGLVEVAVAGVMLNTENGLGDTEMPSSSNVVVSLVTIFNKVFLVIFVL
ncbi:hypothetical protein EAI_00678 [Harpegnathos saltator]|uniref:Uncharacterized protein n=1 Tax=Harpegnathos saltator TaxID=610380 RepID=E2BT27_HARSA|nr:hypothetical protein EAI_00678 [Harpegnathos saltator]